MRFLILLCVLAATLTAAGTATASATAQSRAFGVPQETERHARLELLADSGAIIPGEPFWVAVDFRLDPHWHIYWKNPGDSGLEPTLDWRLPDGFRAGDIHWPPPERIEYSGLYNYGYEDRAGLLIPVTAPDVLPDGPLTLGAEVSYLICKEICIPEEASLSLRLTPGAPTPQDTAKRLADLRESLPEPLMGRAEYDINQERVYLAFDLAPHLAQIELPRIYRGWWYPLDHSTISNAEPQDWRLDATTLILETAREGNATPEPFKGVLEIGTTDGQTHHLLAEAAYAPATADTPTDLRPAAQEEAGSVAGKPLGLTVWAALAFAFLGGIILNIMPCVLPVLSLKALSISRQSDSRALRIEGLAYTAGVLVSFAVVAGGLIALQQAGESIGWGFQLQSPVFVTILCYILFLVGLNLSGLFHIHASFSGAGDVVTDQHGPAGSFFTGVLAAVLATPCTAPFMATALGFALTQPPVVALLIFLALGFGLAFPFLLITFLPAAARLLPKPGAWMERFKQFLAFPIYATVIWLIWVLVQQIGPIGLVRVLSGMLLIAFLIWLAPMLHRFIKAAALLAVLVALFYTLHNQPVSMTQHTPIEAQRESEPFSMETLETYLAEGRPVFVNATAAWCITCKVNERVALHDSAVVTAKRERGVVTLVADWTNRNREIAEYLASFERNGVPLYVYYEPGKAPQVLPQLLTPGLVLDYLKPSPDTTTTASP